MDCPADVPTLLARSVWPEPRWLAARYGQVQGRLIAAVWKPALRGLRHYSVPIRENCT